MWHPAVIYMFMLVAVVLVSWIGSCYEIRSATGNTDQLVRSVLTPPGLRWMGRTAAGALVAAPFGQAVMLLLSVGVIKRSGLLKAISKPESARQRVSLILAAVIFVVVLLLILSGLLLGQRPFLSLTGTIAGSPIAENPLSFILLLVLTPSLAFGFSAGKLKTLSDCVDIMTHSIKDGAAFLLTMMVAAQLIQVLDYTRLLSGFGMTEQIFSILSFLIYWIPFPVLLRRECSRSA